MKPACWRDVDELLEPGRRRLTTLSQDGRGYDVYEVLSSIYQFASTIIMDIVACQCIDMHN